MSLKSEEPRGMSPSTTARGHFDSEPIMIDDTPVFGPVKSEPQEARTTRKPKVSSSSHSAAPAPLPPTTEYHTIASSRSDSRKSSRSSRSGGTERSRSPSVAAVATHRGPGAIAASPMHEVGRSSPASPHEAAEEALAAVACAPTPNPENHAFLRRFDLSVWQGVLPEKFVSQNEVELWEARDMKRFRCC